jgi:hypothetical protein
LLLTDGHANLGITSSQGIREILNHLLQDVNPALSVTTVGYGANHNAELLQQIAILGSGSYNIVTNLEEVASIFGEVFGGLSTIVAQNLSVTLPDDTIPFTGYHVENNVIKVGDLYAENEIILFYTVNDVVNASLPVKISYDNMIDYTHHDITETPLLNNANPPAKNITISFYRLKVSNLLKKIATEGPSDDIKQEAQRILERLNLLDYKEDLIIQMLMDECEKIISTNHISHSQAVNYLQHSAYFSLGRGLRSTEEEDVHSNSILHRATNLSYDSDGSEDSNPVVMSAPRRNLSSVQSPFSNRMQNRHSEAMRTLSTQQPED